jgi:hypothetical protein
MGSYEYSFVRTDRCKKLFEFFGVRLGHVILIIH